MSDNKIGVVNAHMFGTPAAPGEHVDWSSPDLFTEAEAEDVLGDVATYAADNPHMIVFLNEDEEYVSRCPACGQPIDYCQGHGIIGDPAGYAVLSMHDNGDHSQCHPAGCDDAA